MSLIYSDEILYEIDLGALKNNICYQDNITETFLVKFTNIILNKEIM